MTSVSDILKYLEDNNQDYPMDQNMECPQRAKKRRLDHLSWEEKLQRKKLKNRVAAQTSRDRKKAKMEQLEQAVQQLFAQNETLLSECESLRLANGRLEQENARLLERLQEAACPQSRPVECETPNGSAVSDLLPKGRATHSAAALNRQVAALWKVILTCLLYRTCSTNSTSASTLTHWNNLRKASCRISPETWRQLLREQIVRNQQSLEDQIVLEKWWGRHTRHWNPIDVRC